MALRISAECGYQAMILMIHKICLFRRPKEEIPRISVLQQSPKIITKKQCCWAATMNSSRCTIDGLFNIHDDENEISIKTMKRLPTRFTDVYQFFVKTKLFMFEENFFLLIEKFLYLAFVKKFYEIQMNILFTFKFPKNFKPMQNVLSTIIITIYSLQIVILNFSISPKKWEPLNLTVNILNK